MTIVELRKLWMMMRRQQTRFSIEEDYHAIRRITLVVKDIEERMERYSLAVTRQGRAAASISDGLLGVYCWIQSSVLHMQAMAERDEGLTRKPNRDCL